MIVVDEGSAADALLAAAGGQRDLRLANVPADDVSWRALRSLGAQAVVAQHEMRLRLLAEQARALSVYGRGRHEFVIRRDSDNLRRVPAHAYI